MSKSQPAGRSKTLRWKGITKMELCQRIAGQICAEWFLPSEAWTIIFGRIDHARWAFRKAYLRSLCDRHLDWSGPRPAQAGKETRADPRPPSTSLSRLNCSCVKPTLVCADRISPSTMMSENRRMVEQAYRDGEPWPQLLDFFAVSSGISHPVAAALLKNMIGFAPSETELTAVGQARTFWNHYAEGRARLLGLQLAGEVPVRDGDWAHFDYEQLSLLLPGVILPDHHRRAEYLTNYVTTTGPATLDLYSLSGEPLCRHPFRSYLDQLLAKKRQRMVTIST